MIIKSYLVYPVEEASTNLHTTLNQIVGCEAIKAENQDLLILVTEADDKTADETLFAQLKELPTIASITLVSGHNEPDSIPLEVGIK